MGEMHWSAEITYVGRGEYCGSVLDGLRREMDNFQGTLKEVKGWMLGKYAGLPVLVVPFRLS